jgi:SAM-dependent methyltransferase
MEAKQQREQQFHDRIFSDGTRRSADKYYSVLHNSRLRFENVLNAHHRGSVLEYGCGPGSYAFYLGERGATVRGIDISGTAIELATRQAADVGLPNVRFQQMDAERLTFDDASFDLICGVAILHHLDLDKAFTQIARTLKPGGEAVFMEPLGHNPFINLYRKLTPALRTVDEHPLTMSDLSVARRYFHRVDARFFTLNSLFAVPLRNTRFFKGALHLLERTDAMMFDHLPPTRRYAWQVVLTLADPRRPGDR